MSSKASARPKRTIKEPSSQEIFQEINKCLQVYNKNQVDPPFDERDPPGTRHHWRAVPAATKIYTPTFTYEVQERAVNEVETLECLKYVDKPNKLLKDILDTIRNKDWDNECTIIIDIRRLLKYHPQVVLRELKIITDHIVRELSSTRQRVARLAVVAIGEMVISLPRHMSKVLDMVYGVLVSNYTKRNLEFIKNDIERCLMSICDSGEISYPRLLQTAIYGRVSTPGARRLASAIIVEAVPRIGANRVLVDGKDLTRLLETLYVFLTQGPRDVIFTTRKIIGCLVFHDEYFTKLKKNIVGLKHVTKLIALTDASQAVKDQLE